MRARRNQPLVITLAAYVLVSASVALFSDQPAKPSSGQQPKPSDNKPAAANLKLESVQLLPPQFVLTGKWAHQTLLVLGRLSDGSVQDLTASAKFSSADSKIATVNEGGIVRPAGDGQTTISVAARLGNSTATAQAQVTVQQAQDDSLYFTTHVRPLLSRLGCNQTKCHGSLQGKSRFKLSMFEADPKADYEALTKDAEGRRVNPVEPAKSLFLLKATAAIKHGGKQRTPKNSPEYNMLAAWVVQGMPFEPEKPAQLIGLQATPEHHVLQKGQSLRLLATATFSDGSSQDITGYATYSSTDPTVASVQPDGTVKAASYGQAYVIVRYLRRSDTVRITVPQPLPGGFPKVAANNRIDKLVLGKLRELGIPPSDLCSDAEFLRRACLDVTGSLPTPDQVRAFLADKDPQKRNKLIDRLLASSDFADFWALKWSDLLRIKTGVGVVRPAAGETYYRWVRRSIAENKPYDQFARELITATGSNYDVGPANFYTPPSGRDPQSFAEAIALVFMGVRIGCARCHAHPTENWTLDDNLGLAAFFSTVTAKRTREWTEEIVYSNPKRTLRHPKTGQLVKPKFLDGEVMEEVEVAEAAARQAEAAANQAKAAADRAKASLAAAEKNAAAKGKQAEAAKKKLDELVQKQKPAEQKLAAANKALSDATAAKAEADKALAAANAALAKAQNHYKAAQTTAKQAQSKAEAVAKDDAKSDQDKKKAADQAAAKRKAAEAAKNALAQAQKKQQQAQGQADAAAKRVAQAQNQKKTAQQALAKINQQLAAATAAYQAAAKAAKDALNAIAAAKAEVQKTEAAQQAAYKTAILKRSQAIEIRRQDPRIKFAQWLTSPDNPWFARNIVNRVWFWLFARGIVHEPDDLRSTNPPENAELLQYLEKELVSHNFDLRHIFRLILTSRTYQLSSRPNQWNESDVAHFSHYRVKRLTAEQLFDAISQITENWERFRNTVAAPNVTMPAGYHAKQIPDGTTGTPFLDLFGRASRSTPFESQRSSNPSMRQALYLANSEQLQSKIRNSPRLRRLVQEKTDPEAVDELYLAAVCRYPTEQERKKVLEYVYGETGRALAQAEAEKKAAAEALAKVKEQLAKANAEYQAAERAAKDAAAAATKARNAAQKAQAAQNAAAKTAADKRKLANEAKNRLDELKQKQKKAARQDLEKLTRQVQAATAAYQAAEKAAKEAEAAAKTAKEAAEKARTAQAATAQDAANKRKTANDAKAKRDKLTSAQKAANAALVQADKKVNAAKTAHQRQRLPALQDVLWALLNTKEFLFNH